MVWAGTSMLEPWRSQVRNLMPAKVRGLPYGLSSSYRACLVRVTSPMWFANYYIRVGFYPVRTQRKVAAGFPCHQKKTSKVLWGGLPELT